MRMLIKRSDCYTNNIERRDAQMAYISVKGGYINAVVVYVVFIRLENRDLAWQKN